MRNRGKDTRVSRAIELFACPTCKVRPGQRCVDRDGQPLKSLHGPGCHSLRRKLISTLNKINLSDPPAI